MLFCGSTAPLIGCLYTGTTPGLWHGMGMTALASNVQKIYWSNQF